MSDVPPIDNSQFSRAPLDPTTSDQAWNRNFDRIADFARAISGNLDAEDGSPLYTERFLGYVGDPPKDQSDYTDARYYVHRAVPQFQLKATDQLSVQDDALAMANTAYRSIVTATNIAEMAHQADNKTKTSAGQHELQKYQIVLVFAFPEQGNPGKVFYVFNQVPPRPFFASLVTDGGANASTPTGTATYTYTIKSPDSAVTIATGVSPNNSFSSSTNREQGVLTGPATCGMVRQNPDGSYTIISCNERRAVVACP